MQDVKVVSAILWEDRCHERVGDGFKGSVCISEDEHAPVKITVSVRCIGCSKGYNGRENVSEQSQSNEFAVANFVYDDAADDNAEAEARKTSSANSS